MKIPLFGFQRDKRKCFCAFCKSPRRLETKRHINWMNVGLAGLTAFVLMWIFWFEINPKAIVIFVMALALSEVFVQIRWRLSLVCPHCQFDPLLYLKKPEEAAARVRRHFEQVQESPKFAMGYHPLQKLQLERRKHMKSARSKKTSLRS